MGHDDDDYAPPCPCARQLVGMLFGVVVGIIVLILSQSRFMLALMMSLAISFGALGSEVFSPAHFSWQEFGCLTAMNFVSAYPLFGLFREATMANILFVSLIISSYIMPVKMVFTILEKSRKLDKEDGDSPFNAGKSCYPV